MTKTVFMEKYPVFSLEIKKDETTYESVDEIIEYLKGLIDTHPIAIFISIFDHYTHTSSLASGEISPDIKNAKNLIFCFGKQILNTKILAVRPRSIGICELQSSFTIDLLEAPNEQLHKTIEKWAKSIVNK